MPDLLRIGVDIGGTFTDFAIWDGNPAGYPAVRALKLPSTPPDFARAVQRGLELLLADGTLRPDTPLLLVHGTTVSTNAVIERSGPPLALLVTAGFPDILSVARLRLDKPTDLFARRAAPLIPRRAVFEVNERLRADGRVDTPLDPADAIAAARRAVDAGASALAICFLHAYRNPIHEQQAAAAIRSALPELDLVLSHEVWPQQSEYERASATLLNAYARRAMSGYIAELEAWMAQRLPAARLLVTKSNGGVMSAAEATRMPLHTLLSGPAAGVSAAAALGAMLGEPNLLTMDMGGTSTDISLISAGQVMTSNDGRVGDFPIMMPVTAIEAIGAGGGSIAWLDGDALNSVLKVGPRSAGASPGPACYGRGGILPAVSDAYLLCGYLAEDAPLAGELFLRRDLAETAMQPLADRLSRDVTAAAEAVVAVATANMLAGALPFIARLGVAPSELTLMIFGGAGAIHGPLLADEIGIGRVIVPRLSAVFCGFGGLVSDLLYDVVANVHGQPQDDAALEQAYATLGDQGTRWLAAQATDATPQFERYADIRYAGQSFDVPTRVGQAPTAAALAEAFHAEHEKRYGHASPGAPIEIISLRLRVRGILPGPAAIAADPAAKAVPPPATRRARFNGAWHDVPLYAWADLPIGHTAQGPAIVAQETATVVVPPAFRFTVGRFGDLILDRIQAGRN